MLSKLSKNIVNFCRFPDRDWTNSLTRLFIRIIIIECLPS